MFSNSGHSSQWMGQDASLWQSQFRRMQEERKPYDNLIKKVAEDMISDFEKLRDTLENAITAYLKKVEGKLFRNAGCARANELKIKITEAHNTAQLIPSLIKVINEVSTNEDSLISFIFKGINLNFCDKDLIKLYPHNSLTFSYTKSLNDLIKEINKQLEPICLKTFSDSDKNMENNSLENTLQKSSIVALLKKEP